MAASPSKALALLAALAALAAPGLGESLEAEETCALLQVEDESRPLKVKHTREVEADATPEVIFGSGNDNGGFALTQGRYKDKKDTERCVEVALRAKTRFNPTEPENNFRVEGKIYGPWGVHGEQNCECKSDADQRSCWNMEWSVNSDCDGSGPTTESVQHVGDLTYELCISLVDDAREPVCYDPINGNPLNAPFPYYTASFGDAETGNGQGRVAPRTPTPDFALYAGLKATQTVAQESWNIGWIPGFLDSFAVTEVGEWKITLKAFRPPCKKYKKKVVVASTEIRVKQDADTRCGGAGD